MSDIMCPVCGAVIPWDDVNVSTDIALCRACSKTHALSVIYGPNLIRTDVALSRPPTGVWVRQDGRDMSVGAKAWSISTFLALLVRTMFWNGIVSIFVLFAVAASLYRAGIAQPSWFPTPTMSGNPVPLGAMVFLWIFLAPFIAVGTLFLAQTVVNAAGRVEMRVAADSVEVFTGVGRIGIRRGFQPVGVQAVTVENRRWRTINGGLNEQRMIVIRHANGTFKFGSVLPEARMKFVASVLAKALRVSARVVDT